ncbi:hypothetical protein BGX29_009868 [Mortierella sp. GBA35]|nr:hypothetical protein BGX29_009868 [Mortierella sp. GBA35]
MTFEASAARPNNTPAYPGKPAGGLATTTAVDELTLQGLSISAGGGAAARGSQAPYPLPPTQDQFHQQQQHHHQSQQYQQYQQYPQQYQQYPQQYPQLPPQAPPMAQYQYQQQQQYPPQQPQQQYQQYQQQTYQPPQQQNHQQQQYQYLQQQQLQQQQQQPYQQQPQQQYHQKQELPGRNSTDSQLTTASLPMDTTTITITTNGDQTRSVAFDESQSRPQRQQAPPPLQQQQHQLQQPQQQQQQKRASQVPAVPTILTPAQQREAEADANIQKAIELHENNQLEEATHYFRLAAQSDNPVGQLMYGLSLRHGWGCTPNPKDAIFYLQRAAEYAMGELKELNPASSANIRAIQSHPSMRGARAAAASGAENQPLKRMGTIDRRSAMLTARKELVMALYELGMSFLKGWGVSKDKVIAFHYFKLAADFGDPDSQNETAQCFLDGVGTEKNAFEAARYYRMAADQGASQLGNSWIWKPKYDQYCEQHAAQVAVESAARKAQNGKDGVMTAPVVPPITTGGLSPTTGGGEGFRSSLKKHLYRKSFGLSPTTPSTGSGGPATAPVTGPSIGATTTTAGGMDRAEAARKGRYNLAGDLISSSQLELKIKQAEQLTNATVGPIHSPVAQQNQDGSGKKKHHRWSIWNATSRHRRTNSSE